MANFEFKIDKLNASNYITWKTVIKSQLMGKNLWDYVLSIKNEEDEDLVKNEQAKSIMYASMEPRQIAATGVCETAHALWIKIQENHEGALDNLRSSALAEFLSMKYQKGENLITFSGRFELSLNKLESTGHEVDDKTKIWVFSHSLPQHLRATVQMYTMANPFGDVNGLISQLKIQYHLDQQLSDRTATALQTAETNKRVGDGQSTSDRNSVTCNYCKKPNHVWRECRKLKSDNQRKKSFGQKRESEEKYQQQQTNKNQSQSFNKQRAQNNQQQQSTKPRNQIASGGQSAASAFNAKAHSFSEGRFTWIVDSGATSHMTPYNQHLINYEQFETPRPITLGDGKSVEACGVGDLPFTSSEYKGELKRVLWVPKLKENLFSICRAMDNDCSVEFNNCNSMVYFYRDGQVVLEGSRRSESGYFLIEVNPTHTRSEPEESTFLGASYEEWHRRLGHFSMDAVKTLVKSGAVEGMIIRNKDRHECDTCIKSKICRVHHPERHNIQADENSAILHLDTVGKITTPSISGSQYFVLATDEYSGYKLFETMASKSQIPTAVKRLINRSELESGRTVKAIMTDNGTEFRNEELQNFLRKRGIIHKLSVTYTPEQNGKAERANRIMIDGVRTILIDAQLPGKFWAEALNTVVYVANRVTSRTNASKTHYELYHSKKPNIGNLRIFGQRAIIKENDNAREDKFSPKGMRAIFVGYTERFNTYRFYISKPVEQIIVTCDARFLDISNTPPPPSDSDKPEQVILRDRETIDNATDRDYEPEVDMSSSGDYSDTLSHLADDNIEVDSSNQPSESSSSDESEPVRQTRSMTRKLQTGENSEAVHFGAMFTLDDEPRTLKDAKESRDWLKWQDAMQDEINALAKNKTWILVDRPSGVRPIKNKWVYRVKLTPEGTIDRYKARLVAKGFTQIENIDYKETYAPVASMTTVRMLLAIANQMSMHIVQFDIKTAFLYGDLDETLYMEQPEGYVQNENKVCKLVKSLYGLKQAPRQWNKKFDSFLKLFNLTQSNVDKCVYFNNDRSLLLAIYVDDGLATGRDKNQLDNLISYLRDNFELKSMECKTYLSLQITRNLAAKTLDICQSSYIDKILNRFGMSECNPASTPEEVGASFKDSPALPSDNQFKELVGSLLYLATCSRPDISHAVSLASRTSQPTQAHWNALKRILRYLKGTKHLAIRFRWEKSNALVGYSDADYANDEQTRKSTTGYCIFYGGGPIAWRCQRQPIITLSTTEAEYVAGCELVKEILPIREQLIELGQLNQDEPTQVLIDNQSTVRIASNEAGQKRTKHIDIREKWLTEQVQLKKIKVDHVSGDQQAADILTKPLYKTKFQTNRSKLLTLLTTLMSIILLFASGSHAIDLKLTDPLTTVPSNYAAIRGDTRYRLTNVFLNPCENLFNYSSSIYQTQVLIKNCFEFYTEKHLNQLPNCQRLPTIGPNLQITPSTYDCVEGMSSDGSAKISQSGRCEVSRRRLKPLDLPDLGRATQDAWNRHKKLVEGLTPISREKRFVPVVAGVAAVGLISIFAGATIKTVEVGRVNAENINKLDNLTSFHTTAIKDATQFFDLYRSSVEAMTAWTSDIEERLGIQPMESHLIDPLDRGKKANLVKSYMQWFNSQEKLLSDINQAAYRRQVPQSVKKMLNITQQIDKIVNWSTLIDCNYQLVNRSMVLNLDFILPELDDYVEILKVLPMNVYSGPTNLLVRNEDSSDSNELMINETMTCWQKYTGPTYVLHNKTNGCFAGLDESKAFKGAVRAQTCTNPKNELYFPTKTDQHWTQDTCYKLVPMIEERIQIHDIDGVHKIYCHPFSIEIEGEKFGCPNSAFILEAHTNYKIGNIVHKGDIFETSIVRQARSTDSRRRSKRSPVATILLPTTPPIAFKTDAPPPKINITSTLKNITYNMDITLGKIKETVKQLPDSLNLTRADVESILLKPLSYANDGMNWVGEKMKTIGTSIGLLSTCVMLIILMPIIELIIIGLKVVKIPAGLWIGSARRVTGRLRGIRIPIQLKKASSITSLFNKSVRRHRWNQAVNKMV